MRSSPGHQRQRGAALIMVVVVIAALLVIAAPFVVSMRLHEKSGKGFSSELQAKQLANAGRNMAIAKLLETHPDEERRLRVSRGDLGSDPEGVDALDELRAAEDLGGGLAGIATLSTDSSTGTLLQVRVKDSRSRLDINTCGPVPLANLLGVTTSTRVLTFEETKTLHVEDTSAFFSDGDPETIDGILRVGREELYYRHTTPTAFLGLSRGVNFTRMNKPKEDDALRNYHPPGALVQDARGFKVALDGMWRLVGTIDEGKLGRFENTAGIRRIADWELATERAAWYLFGVGLNLKRLRSLGIGGKDIAGAGLTVEDFDKSNPDRSQETREQRARRREAETRLGAWGIPVKYVRQRGGDAGVLRLYTLLDSLASDQRKKLVAFYTERLSKRKNADLKLDAWQKKELKRQFKILSEARNDAPHLETIGRIELEEKIRPFVTTDAPPEGAAWSDPQVVNHRLFYDPDRQVASVGILDARRFGRYRVARFKPLPRADGAVLPTEYRFVINVRKNSRLAVFPQLDQDFLASTVEVSCRQPRPINVNTASREVLHAVLTGLQSRGQKVHARGGVAPDFVTPTEARAVADALITSQAPLANLNDLRGLLLDLRAKSAISDLDVDAILRNAADPGDPGLGRSTVPFCYRTGDVYEITTTGIVNDPAGNELARHTYKDVLRVAPPRDLTWSIDSQAEFSDRWHYRGKRRGGFRDSANFLFLPGRWKHMLQTRPAYLGPYSATPFQRPSYSHAPGRGDLQPLLSREPQTSSPPGSTDEPDWQAGSGGPTVGGLAPNAPRRWDTDPDGAALSSVTLRGAQLGTRWYRLEDGTGQAVLGPGSLRAWFRLDRLPAGGAKGFIFDGGVADAIDRASLYIQDGDLVFALHDEAMDELETGGVPRAQELRYSPPSPFVQGNWYHFAAFWKGTEPGDMALAVDGRFVGGRPSIGTRLTQPLDPLATTLTVEDASGFPPSGFVRIGASRRVDQPGGVTPGDRGIAGTAMDANGFCEVLEYYAKRGNTLQLRTQVPIDSAAVRVLEVQQQRDRFATEPRQQSLPTQPNVTLQPGQAVRQPVRGSGVPYRRTYQMPAPQGTTQLPRPSTGLVNLGFSHAVGTVVLPYGYHARVKNDPPGPGAFQDVVRVGGRSLRVALPQNTPVTVLYKPIAGYNPTNPTVLLDPFPEVVTATETQIPVLWAKVGVDPIAPKNPQAQVLPNETDPANVVGGWPPRGIVRISSWWTSPATNTVYQNVERVYYRGIRRAPGAAPYYVLDRCERGVLGTTASAHPLFATVVLESIELDGDPGSPTDPAAMLYPPRLDIADPRAYVSLSRPKRPLDPKDPNALDVEWLSIQHLDPDERRRRLDNANLLLIPARDSLQGGPASITLPNGVTIQLPGPGPGQVLPPRYSMTLPQPLTVNLRDLLAALLLQSSGTFADPDLPNPGQGLYFPANVTPPLFTQLLPVEVRGQSVKEVLKRWEPSYNDVRSNTLGVPSQLAPIGFGLDPAFMTRGARRAKGTSAPTGGHPVGTKVVPTFAVARLNGSAPLLLRRTSQTPPMFFFSRGGDAGRGDVVTITDDQTDLDPLREEMRVVHMAPSSRILPGLANQLLAPILAGFGLATDASDGWLVAFDDFVAREYQGSANARIARWPVGNLQSRPDLTFGRARPETDAARNPVSDKPGTLEGRIDDLVVEQLSEDVSAALPGPLTTTDDHLTPLPGGSNQYQRGRLYLTDGGEVIGVTDAADAQPPKGQRGSFTDLTLLRGALGSTAQPLGSEATPWRLNWPPIAIAEGGIGGRRKGRIPTRNPRGAGASPWREGLDGGYVAVDRGGGQGYAEAIPYAASLRDKSGWYLQRPVDRFERGAFRSAFGSGLQDPVQGSLLVDLPFRGHDRYGDRVSSLQGVFFQAARELPGSLVFSVDWDEQLWTPYNEVKVAVRLDGGPSWDSKPTKTPGLSGRLYLFDDPKEANEVFVRANRVELRVYVTFKRGAFTNDAWKRAAVVGGVRVKYRQPTQTIRHEERTE